MIDESSNYAIETYLRIRPSREDADKIGYRVRDVIADNGANRQFLKVEVPPNADLTFAHNNTNGK